MAFDSPEYLFFFLSVLGVSWYLVGLPRVRIWFMLLASYFFYVSNNHWLIVLILVSTQIDYWCAIGIESARSHASKKQFLLASLVANLGILGLFKYFNFFRDSVSDLVSLLGYNLSWVDLHLVLPVGISFYTFQSMSYTIDVYRGVLPAERSWHRFAFFVAYFPQLVAGPIVRPHDFLPQLNSHPRWTRAGWERGAQFIFQGLFKKVVLADFLAIYADTAFDAPEATSAPYLLLGVWCFTFQIYFDFSGYSDIAIGCSRLMGFTLPDNFRRPYVATCITDFWRRWHISLSTWLRDYLYIPLGGSRTNSRSKIYRNLMITMLLGGLWHGAAWHFVVWGGLQGAFLIVERHCGVSDSFRRGTWASSLPSRAWWTFFTLQLVAFSWIVFRAESSVQLAHFFSSLTDWTAPRPLTFGELGAVLVILFGLATQLFGEYAGNRERFFALPLPVKAGWYATVSLLVTVLGSAASKPFIYFRF